MKIFCGGGPPDPHFASDASKISPRKITENHCRKKKTTPRYFFSKTTKTFVIPFPWNWERKKKWGVTVLVCALQAKLSPTVISTLAKHPQIQRSHTRPEGSLQDRCIGSNASAMAQSVEHWTLNRLYASDVTGLKIWPYVAAPIAKRLGVACSCTLAPTQSGLVTVWI